MIFSVVFVFSVLSVCILDFMLGTKLPPKEFWTTFIDMGECHILFANSKVHMAFWAKGWILEGFTCLGGMDVFFERM